MHIIRALVALSSSLAVALAIPISAAATGSTVIVTPTNTQGWSTADTRLGGAVNFVADSAAPGNPHNGALQLTKDLTTTAKAQYLHAANTPPSQVLQSLVIILNRFRHQDRSLTHLTSW